MIILRRDHITIGEVISVHKQSNMKTNTDVEKAASPVLDDKYTASNNQLSTSTDSTPAVDKVETSPGRPDSKDSGLPDEATEKDEDVPPDGGFAAWCQVVAALLTSTISWGTPTAFGVFELYYVETLKLPDWEVAWIGSVQFLLTYGMCTFSGRLADAGYIRSTYAFGAFLVILGTFTTSVGTKYWHFFLSQGLAVGFGLGIMFMPPLQVLSSYFKKHRTLAMSGAATGTGIGSVILPAIIQYSIPQVGFGWAVRIFGFVALFCTVTSFFLLKPRLEPRKSGPLVEWNAFKETPYLLYSIGVFLLYLALFFGSFYINSFARNIIRLSTTTSVQLLLIQNGISIPFRPLVGYIANYHIGPMNVYIMTSVLFSIVTFAWVAVHNSSGLYAYAAFLGLTNGVCQGMFLGSLASLTDDSRKMGTRIGMVHTIVAFATLAGPPIAGAIIDTDGGRYLHAQIYAGIVILVASGFFVGARYAKTGPHLGVKV
ncbi:MFS general substrate transporter [Xylariaceae sp. FL0255]|nr:MFS general substrate transporter [Xylariaceae sp. FL0255]